MPETEHNSVIYSLSFPLLLAVLLVLAQTNEELTLPHLWSSCILTASGARGFRREWQCTLRTNWWILHAWVFTVIQKGRQFILFASHSLERSTIGESYFKRDNADWPSTRWRNPSIWASQNAERFPFLLCEAWIIHRMLTRSPANLAPPDGGAMQIYKLNCYLFWMYRTFPSHFSPYCMPH